MSLYLWPSLCSHTPATVLPAQQHFLKYTHKHTQSNEKSVMLTTEEFFSAGVWFYIIFEVEEAHCLCLQVPDNSFS